MATVRRTYVVREAGTSSRIGKIHKIYPNTLKALLEAIDDARYRSFAGTAQLVVLVEGKQQKVIRRLEDGVQVPSPRTRRRRWGRATRFTSCWNEDCLRST
jgi:hypothetical protein